MKRFFGSLVLLALMLAGQSLAQDLSAARVAMLHNINVQLSSTGVGFAELNGDTLTIHSNRADATRFATFNTAGLQAALRGLKITQLVYTNDKDQTFTWSDSQGTAPPPDAAAPTPTAARVSSVDQLTDTEVQSAMHNKTRHYVRLDDAMGGMLAAMAYNSSNVSDAYVDVWMPETWLFSLAENSKHQYAQYKPTSDDTMRAITVSAMGLQAGTTSGPTCSSVTRIALISGKVGSVVAEAANSGSGNNTIQNGFGAQATCSFVTAKFLLSDVKRVKAAADRGEFFIGVFYANGSSKLYKVKERFQKTLEL